MVKNKAIKKKKSRKIKWFILLFCIIFLIVFSLAYFKSNILPAVYTMSESIIRSMAVNAINNAAHTVISDRLDYDDLVHIERNSAGDIQFIQANTVKINRLARDLANFSQINVELICEQELALPLGVFTGSVILSGYGPDVHFKVMPIGSVLCDFVSSFEEVGINQTKHSIYLNINTTISLVLPISSLPVNTVTTVLVCENIIVGKVPNTYFKTDSNPDMLDLLPFA